jgi:hypothetical protein
MKTLILLAALITTGAHAEQFYSNEECLRLYKTFLTNFEASKVPPATLMVHFSDMCMPEGKQIVGQNLQYDALLTAMENDKTILALEASLVEQGL